MTKSIDRNALISELDLTVESVFVPFSQSRNKAEKQPSLNWRVTIKRDGRDILTTDYMAGAGHCPAYKASVKAMGGANSIMRQDAITFECEHGHSARRMEGIDFTAKGSMIEPNILDVLYSLVSDACVLDNSSFEEWAGDFGYDVDSRSAEKIYQACLSIALKLRAGLGDARLQSLRNAFEGY